MLRKTFVKFLRSYSEFLSKFVCGLSPHSAIFQLHSDETVVHFPNLDLLPDTQHHHGQIGVFYIPSLPRSGKITTQDLFLTSLPSEGPNAVRLCRVSNPGLPIHSPARYTSTAPRRAEWKGLVTRHVYMYK